MSGWSEFIASTDGLSSEEVVVALAYATRRYIHECIGREGGGHFDAVFIGACLTFRGADGSLHIRQMIAADIGLEDGV